MTQPGFWQWVAILWFALSVMSLVGENFVFYLWLRRVGVPLSFVWSGIPGYLDARYIQWCKEHGRPPWRGRILVRRVLLLNAVAAAIVFWLVAGRLAR